MSEAGAGSSSPDGTGAAGSGSSGPATPREPRRGLFQPVAFGVLFGLTAGVLIAVGAIAPTRPPAPTPATATPAEPSAPGEPVRWRMASAFPGTLVQLGTGGQRLVATLARISAGTIELGFAEPGTAAYASDVFTAVKSGTVEAGWSLAAYWSDEIPAAAFFAAVPFGPGAAEYLAWMRFGGGQEIHDRIYERHGVKGIVCAVAAPEASGWFRKEIGSVADLAGLKMRFYGLGGRVMRKLGVTTRLPAGDVFPALQEGTLDALEYSMPAIDVALGFDAVAKHYYFPGWHQQSTIVELIINLEKWNGLADLQRAWIEAACGDNVQHTLAEGEAIQHAALADLSARGVQIHRWPAPMLAAFKAAWAEVADEVAAEDADFRQARQSLRAFRDAGAAWRRLGYL